MKSFLDSPLVNKVLFVLCLVCMIFYILVCVGAMFGVFGMSFHVGGFVFGLLVWSFLTFYFYWRLLKHD